jgi:glycosyltransferase involved in cell wall biosynthesis
MLGWEFPPIINGGLGVACEGLGRALSGKVDLTFIVPQTNPAFLLDQVDLIGLNHHSPDNWETGQLETFAEVDLIPADLHPYADACPRAASEGPLYGSEMGQRVVGFARAAATIAEEKTFDIIHAHDWMTFLAGMEIKKRSGKPLVLHVHSLTYDRSGAGSRGWIYEIEKSAMKNADLVIAVSRYTREICLNHYLTSPEKVVTVHNGVDSVTAFHSPKPFPEKLILFLGRMTGQKGPDLFLKIAHRVYQKNPEVRFVMAGSGDQLHSLMSGSMRLGIRNRCHFTDFLHRQEVHQLLSMTDVYCMPSVSEPFGLSALEAAQFGIPAVISRQSGVAEILTHARQADSWDLDLMARHLVELTTDENAHRQASQAALKDQKKATWERAAKAVVTNYHKLLADQ